MSGHIFVNIPVISISLGIQMIFHFEDWLFYFSVFILHYSESILYIIGLTFSSFNLSFISVKVLSSLQSSFVFLCPDLSSFISSTSHFVTFPLVLDTYSFYPIFLTILLPFHLFLYPVVNANWFCGIILLQPK